MTNWKSLTLTGSGIVCSVAAVLCGDAIQSSTRFSQMLAISFLSVGLLVVALLLVAAGQIAEANEQEKENRKIKRSPTHCDWRGDCE